MKYNHEESCECGHHHTHHHEESCQCGHDHHYAEECDEDDCTCCDEDHENLHQPDK